MSIENNRSPRLLRLADPNCKVAIFDLDGTLVETDAANTAAYRDALRLQGLADRAWQKGRITRSVLRKLCPTLTTEDLRTLVATKVERTSRCLGLTRLGPAVGALREVLAHRETFSRVVLLTESSARRCQETLRFWGLEGLFDEVVCNGGRGGKYVNYFAHHAVDPAACRVFENENFEIASALSVGVKYENIRKVA